MITWFHCSEDEGEPDDEEDEDSDEGDSDASDECYETNVCDEIVKENGTDEGSPEKPESQVRKHTPKKVLMLNQIL